MANNKLIFDILAGKNTLKPELNESSKAATSLSKTFSSFGSSLFSLKTAVAGVFVGLGIKKAIDEATELQSSLLGLKTVARATGNDVGSLTQTAIDLASDGLIPLRDVSASLKNLLASGLSADQALKTFDALKNAAAFNRQGYLDLGEAITGATQGIKNGNSILVDNAGITKNLSVLQKEYASSIGTTIGKLTERQKVEAVFLGIQKEAALFQGDYNKLLLTFGGAQSKVAGNFQFLAASVGSLVTENKAAVNILNVFGDGLKSLRVFVEENKKGLQALVTDGLTFFIQFSSLAVQATSYLIEGFVRLGNVTKKLADEAFGTALEQAEKDYKAFTDGSLQATDIYGNKVENTFASVAKARVDRLKEEEAAEKQSYQDRLKALGEFRTKIDEIAKKSLDTSDDQEVAETPGGKRELSDSRIDNEIQAQERIKKIREEYALIEEQERLDKRENLTSEEEEKLIALEERLGREAAIRLTAQENLAKSEEEKLKASLDKKQALYKADFNANASIIDGLFKFEKLTGEKRVAAQRDSLNSIATLQSSNNKTLFAIGKASAISIATIDGIQAVQKALAAFPPPFNFAVAGLVGVAQAANLAKIASAQPPAMNDGGILSGRPSGDQNIARFNGGEMFLTRAQQTELFNVANGRQSIESSEEKPIIVSVQINEREIARAVRNASRNGYAVA